MRIQNVDLILIFAGHICLGQYAFDRFEATSAMSGTLLLEDYAASLNVCVNRCSLNKVGVCSGVRYHVTNGICHLLAAIYILTSPEEVFDSEWRMFRKVCPSNNWLAFNGSCYLLVTENQPHEIAQNQCVIWGAHLATITSQQEDEALKHYLNGKNINYAFLGGNDEAEENKWVWSTGEEMTYTGWYGGEPSNGRDENCLAMNALGWFDFPCESSSEFICEI